MPKGCEDDARAFYAGLLGLTEVAKPEPMRANGGVWFAEGSTSRARRGSRRLAGRTRRSASTISTGWLRRSPRRAVPSSGTNAGPACGGSTRAIRLGTELKCSPTPTPEAWRSRSMQQRGQTPMLRHFGIGARDRRANVPAAVTRPRTAARIAHDHSGPLRTRSATITIDTISSLTSQYVRTANPITQAIPASAAMRRTVLIHRGRF